MSEQGQSDQGHTERFASRDIPLAPGTGFIGMGTVPGMAATQVTALRFEAESYAFEGEVVETVWLMARVPDDGRSPSRLEFLMCAARARELEPVVAALAEAAVGRSPMTGLRMPGAYQGYHDSAQVAADAGLTEECRENLTCEVRRGPLGRGVELVLRDAAQAREFERASRSFPTGGSDRAVARLNAVMAPEAAAALLAEFAGLKAWQGEARKKIEDAIDAEPAAPAPVF